MVTNVQLYLAIGIPMLFNATIIGILIALMNAKFAAVNSKFDAMEARFEAIDTRFEALNHRFEAINTRFEAVNQRFDRMDERLDEMRDLWRAELRRVEEVLDARLKHLEQRR